jgi:hypothetical protein
MDASRHRQDFDEVNVVVVEREVNNELCIHKKVIFGLNLYVDITRGKYNLGKRRLSVNGLVFPSLV